MSGAPDPQVLAERVVEGMIAQDGFSAWLGLELLDLAPGHATCRMRVRRDMLNGFGVCHGGVTFSLADSAFAFACNTHGRVTVSIEKSITYPAQVREGDVLTAVAEEESAGKRLAFFRVTVTNQEAAVVGLFRGTAYPTDRPHPPAAPAGERA